MRFATIPDFLPAKSFHDFRQAVLERLHGNRVHIVGHKRGATISYVELESNVPVITSFYRSSELRGSLSEVLGVSVIPTPLYDQSSCSILIYDQPGDRIGWHFDHNFYNGRHFTVLLPLVNESYSTGALSSANLLIN